MRKELYKSTILIGIWAILMAGCSPKRNADVASEQETTIEEQAAVAEETIKEEAKEEPTEPEIVEETIEEEPEVVEEEYEMPSPICIVKNTTKYNDSNDEGFVFVTGEKDDIKIAPKPVIDFGKGASDYKDLAESVDMIMKLNGAGFDNEFSELSNIIEDTPEEYFPFYCNSKVSVPRADSVLMSIIILSSDFTGGAHGNYGVTTYCLDSETGNELKLSDIVTDTSKLPDMILKAIDEDVMLQVEKGYFETAVKNNEVFFIVDNVGLTFYFNPYEIAPYADGIVTATIPFFNNEDLFVRKYQNTMPSYAANILAGVPYIDYTVNGNRIDPLYLYSVSNSSNGQIDSIVVAAGDERDEQLVENGQYVEYTFMRSVDAGTYLYAEVTKMDGSMSTYIWKIDSTGSGISFVNRMDNMCSPMYPESIDGNEYFELIPHPEEMVLERAGKVDHYFLGVDGVPEKIEAAE